MKGSLKGALSRAFGPDRPHTAVLLLAFAAMAWGGNIVLGRAIHADIPPIALTFWRWSVACLVMAAFSAPTVLRDLPVIRREWRRLLPRGLVGMVIFHSLLYISVSMTTAINVALILAVVPLMVPAISWIINRERLSGRLLAGALVSLLGVVVVISRADIGTLRSFTFNEGDVTMLVASAAWATYTVLVKDRPVDLHPRSYLVAMMFFASLLLAPVYLWESIAIRSMPFTWTAGLTVAYVAIFASILAYISFNRGIEILGPNKGGLTTHLIPVCATLLAIVLLGEPFRGYHAAGMVLIAAGIVLAMTGRMRAPGGSPPMGGPPRAGRLG